VDSSDCEDEELDSLDWADLLWEECDPWLWVFPWAACLSLCFSSDEADSLLDDWLLDFPWDLLFDWLPDELLDSSDDSLVSLFDLLDLADLDSSDCCCLDCCLMTFERRALILRFNLFLDCDFDSSDCSDEPDDLEDLDDLLSELWELLDLLSDDLLADDSSDSSESDSLPALDSSLSSSSAPCSSSETHLYFNVTSRP
jgi:hypothetical protein